MVQSVDPQGSVQGSVYNNPISGFWDEQSHTLTFLRIINAADPSTLQVYSGYLFQNRDQQGQPIPYFSLAGSMEAFAGTGAVAQRTEYGWYAQQEVIG